MPLTAVGRSDCRFREGTQKPPGPRVSAAVRVFPELADYAWPARGSEAELESLRVQASRFKRTLPPPSLQEAVNALQGRYPNSQVRKCFRQEPWDFQALCEEVQRICQTGELNGTSSPGVPLANIENQNAAVLNLAPELVHLAVAERLVALAAVDPRQHNWTPKELVQRGLVDPVRLFVKQEPHTMRKIRERRFRLISSVSLVDQLVERMLFGPQNATEISMWHLCPSKPGMGMSTPSQVEMLWKDVAHKHSLHQAAEADISAFDWSVQDWELWADLAIRLQLGSFPDLMRRAAISRFYCFMNSVFQLSDGTLIEQNLPGLMKSGSYCTSSTNSRIRCLMAELIGSPWCIAMGDDSVEGWVEGAQEKYAALGHTCKEYVACPSKQGRLGKELLSFNFCSHEFTNPGLPRAELLTWAKCLYRFLSSNRETVDDLWVELNTSRQWGRIQKYLAGIGEVSQLNSADGEIKAEEIQEDAAGCGGQEPAASAFEEAREIWIEPTPAQQWDNNIGPHGYEWDWPFSESWSPWGRDHS
ncbi:RNA-dependent RNA polymerase [Imperata yellow mottle virus]|uniref:RNA-directed RNA polymerase n=3 Tax=Imperata yellow mottle virus TaxID=524023 RepID=B5WYM7_9VIRU|nr:RNA-dependent RNA polymerase [Imperata yellow mottle virus]